MTTLTRTRPNPAISPILRLKALLFSRPERAYAHPYMGGALLGVVLFLAFLVTGNGLGASGGLERFVASLVDLVAPQHVDRVAYLLKLAGGDKNPLDFWVVFLAAGAILGGFFSGWWNGRLRVETGKGPRITVRQRWLVA